MSEQPFTTADQDLALEQIYAQIPDVNCRGLCGESCGPVPSSRRERMRAATRGYRLPTMNEALVVSAINKEGKEIPSCDAYDEDAKRCRVYEVRPVICRLWGAVDAEGMRCPWGCEPGPGQRLLTPEEGHALMAAANHIGGGVDHGLVIPPGVPGLTAPS
jgi:Fe-S-cluster containining protein